MIYINRYKKIQKRILFILFIYWSCLLATDKQRWLFSRKVGGNISNSGAVSVEICKQELTNVIAMDDPSIDRPQGNVVFAEPIKHKQWLAIAWLGTPWNISLCTSLRFTCILHGDSRTLTLNRILGSIRGSIVSVQEWKSFKRPIHTYFIS